MALIYIAWEGRGYSHESLRKDIKVVEEYLKPKGPVFYMQYDVGILISDTDKPDIDEDDVMETRHGESALRPSEDGWDPDFVEDLQNPKYWVKCANIKEMVGDWYMKEFMDACDG